MISNDTKKEADMKHQLVASMSRSPRRGIPRNSVASVVASVVAFAVASAVASAVAISSAASTTAAPLPLALGQDAAVTCTLTPLALPLFDATPPSVVLASLPPVSAVSATPDAGSVRTATREETAAVEIGAETIVACLNTGNPLEAYAVFTTRYLAASYSDSTNAYLPAFEQRLASPTMSVNPPFVFEGVENVGVLGDGRFRVGLTISRGQQTWTDTLVFVKEHDAWLIDDVLSQGS